MVLKKDGWLAGLLRTEPNLDSNTAKIGWNYSLNGLVRSTAEGSGWS